MADRDEPETEAAEKKTSIFDLFEPPPESDPSSFGKIPVIKEDDIDLTDGASVAEAKAAADVEAAGLAHWTAPPTGQVPAVLTSDSEDSSLWADVKGPSWHGDDPSWAGPDLADVFADTDAISLAADDEFDDDDDGYDDADFGEVAVQRRTRSSGSLPGDETTIGAPPPAPTQPPPPAPTQPPPPAPTAAPPPERAARPAVERRPLPSSGQREGQATGSVRRVPADGEQRSPRPAPQPERLVPPPARGGDPDSAMTERSLSEQPIDEPEARHRQPDRHDVDALAGSGRGTSIAPPGMGRRALGDDAGPGDEMNGHDGPGRAARSVPSIEDIEFADDDYYDELDSELGLSPVGGRNIPQAIGVGVALASVVGAAMWFGPYTTLLLVVVLALLGVLELYNAMRMAGLRPATLLGIVGTAAAPAAAYYRGDAAFPLIVALAVVFGTLWYLVGADTERPVLNLSLTMMGIFWVGGLAAFAALMVREDGGIELLLATIMITVASDTMAYIGGRAYGSRPFHHASPNKTWEGTITGLLGAVFAGFAIGVTDMGTLWDGNLVPAIVLGVVVGCLAPIGDLAESVVKRDLGVKDMGALLPGHGGVLDRVDGLLFALPGAFYLGLVYSLI